MKTPDQSQLPDDDLFKWAEHKTGFVTPESLQDENANETEILKPEEPIREEYCPKCQNGGFCLEHQPRRMEKIDPHLFGGEIDPLKSVNDELLIESQHHGELERPLTKKEMDEMFAKMQEELEKLD